VPLPAAAQLARTIGATRKAIGGATKGAMNEAGLVMKTAYLRQMQAKTWSKGAAPTATSVAGFSHHRKASGRRLYARYAIHLDTNGDARLVTWSPPPGPFLLEEGARAHLLASTSRKARRRIIGPRLGGSHGGLAPRPWKAQAVAQGSPIAVRIIDHRYAIAAEKAWGASG
jgi:hypothetical protein